MNDNEFGSSVKFNSWTYLWESELSEHGQIMMKCRCECGKEKYVLRQNLINGRSKCCVDCSYKKRSNVGKKYNMYTVAEILGNGLIRCKCDCGNERIVRAQNVYSGSSKHCGCMRKKKKS